MTSDGGDGAYFTDTTYEISVRAKAVKSTSAPGPRAKEAELSVKYELGQIEDEIRANKNYRQTKFKWRKLRPFTFAGAPGVLGFTTWTSTTDYYGPGGEDGRQELSGGERTRAVGVAISDTTLYVITFAAGDDPKSSILQLLSSVKVVELPKPAPVDNTAAATGAAGGGPISKPAARVLRPRAIEPPDGAWVDIKVSGMHEDYFAVWGAGSTVFVAGREGVYQSDDSAATWKSSLANMWIRSVWGTSKKDVYAVGVGSGIQHSVDGGRSWREVAAPLLAVLAAELSHAVVLEDVWASGKQVFVVGERGVVLHSADRGATFQRLNVGTTASLEDVWGTKDAVFVVGAGGFIAVTRDQGKTWSQVTTTAKKSFWRVWASSANDVYAGGEDGLFHGTADGPWTAIPLPVAGDVTSLWGSSATDLYCVVAAKSLLRTRDGGKTWSETAFHSDPIIYNLWGPAVDDLYFVGSSTARHGT